MKNSANYYRKTKFLIFELNNQISNILLFPNYNGGKFQVRIRTNNVKWECDFNFVEGDEKLVIFSRKMEPSFVIHKNDFFKMCFNEIFRAVLFTEDSVGRLKSASMGENINCLSFKTLAKEGLNKIKINKYGNNGL